jgi:hypothetical protein
LEVDPKYAGPFAQLRLNSCEAVTKFFGERVPPAVETVYVSPKTLPLPGVSPLPVFYKQYEYKSPNWRFIGRASKARCEFRNYGAFRQLGIASPDRVACGEQRDAVGRLRRAFVITTAIPHAWPLPQFVEEFCPKRATAEARRLRTSLFAELAAMTRQIHDANFFHHDLVWRNVLVTRDAPAPPKLWWIDCPRGGFGRLGTRHRRIKDLASLDKVAAQLATRHERLAFVKQYLDKPRLDAEAKQLVRETLAYRQQRWPDEQK